MSICCKCKNNSRCMYVSELYGVISKEAKIDEFKCSKCGDKVEKYECPIMLGKNNIKRVIFTTTGIRNNNNEYEYYSEDYMKQ